MTEAAKKAAAEHAKLATKQAEYAGKNVAKAAKAVAEPVVEDILDDVDLIVVNPMMSFWASNRKSVAFLVVGLSAGYLARPLVAKLKTFRASSVKTEPDILPADPTLPIQ